MSDQIPLPWLFTALAVMLLIAGIRLRGAWVPRAVLGSAAAFVLVFVGLNPDAFVASHNIDRFEAGRELDTAYLARLSADATPVIVERLPNDVASCILASPYSIGGPRVGGDDLLAWNLGRARAADAVASLSAPTQVPDPTASGQRGELCAALLP